VYLDGEQPNVLVASTPLYKPTEFLYHLALLGHASCGTPGSHSSGGMVFETDGVRHAYSSSSGQLMLKLLLDQLLTGNNDLLVDALQYDRANLGLALVQLGGNMEASAVRRAWVIGNTQVCTMGVVCWLVCIP
jgi:hypothetical protein